ncbi:uncharacterized protein LOC114517690 [Dendronephthya gigantea]|uniref:uncharacterized protein LOC114517690 n=1 Tax=Dendronephthya gigantea TaxID=151771 RepID=UPI0010690EDF|nr:uncharacterized protein LOC114517690 [Dendronephthya gigantea]
MMPHNFFTQNYSLTNGIQTKKTFLPPSTLNALRKALTVHPFKTWRLKHEINSMKDIHIDEDKLYAAIYNGWNKRLTHKLHKVMQGEDVYLDVFGGSNSVGGALVKDKGEIDGRYTKVLADWWDKSITPITGSQLKLREIAIGGTSSEFFQFCYASYIHKQLDLVFIEMAVNDAKRELPGNANTSLPLEQFTRQILTYRTEPAIAYINLFIGQTCNNSCSSLEDGGLLLLSKAYNITSLSWRDAVCSEKAGVDRTNRCSKFIASDGGHISQIGHAHISLMIIKLLQTILLKHISSVTRVKKTTRTSDESRGRISRQKIPLPVFIQNERNIISKPLCWTQLSQNITKVLRNNLNVAVNETNGFYLKTTHFGNCKCAWCRTYAYTSWTGRTVGSNMTFSFTIPGGDSRKDGSKTRRSIAIALRALWTYGAANVWLDDDDNHKKFVNAKSRWGRTIVRMLALRVDPGQHRLHVRIVREGEVSILGIMIGPNGGPYPSD